VEIERTVAIVNRSGLHARPCHAIVSLALEYASELRVAVRDREVNGKSILELMTLSAPSGTHLRLRATGADASALVAAVAELVEAGFQEP
jgi:phosphotransferase system enzyme I (PtsI)